MASTHSDTHSEQGFMRRKILQLVGLAAGGTAVAVAGNAATASTGQPASQPCPALPRHSPNSRSGFCGLRREPHRTRSHELRLGAGSYEQIEIVAADSASPTTTDQIRKLITA